MHIIKEIESESDHNRFAGIITVFRNSFQGFETVPASRFTVMNEEHNLLHGDLLKDIEISNF